jgi:flagellar biosynthetic protein FliQ
MTVELAVDLYREALMVAALVALPILGTAMLVGLAISVLQTITSIQDQTLTFVPKIAAIGLTVGLALPWVLSHLMTFLTYILANAPGLVLAH